MRKFIIILLLFFCYVNTDGQEITEVDHYKQLMSRFPFKNYQVQNSYSGKIAIIDTSKLNLPKDIEQKILYQYIKLKKPNFAGHYIIISWGCGLPCQENLIVDAITGKYFETINSAYNLDFCLNSNLIIWNPPMKIKFDKEERRIFGDPKFLLWNENKLIEIRK
jgi:hypothetical protein